ncbi:MAG: ABC transporter substrate-binding protein [Fusobacteriaceae bacterium]
MRNIKKFLAISFAIFFGLNFVGCSKKNLSSEKVLTVATGSKPKSLDPYRYNEFPALIVTEQIYNTLITLDDNGKIISELAKSWRYESPTNIIFKLRSDVKFHNGNIFTADDVVFSFDRMKKSAGSSEAVSVVERVEKLGDYEVKIILKKVSAPFLANLSSPLFAIMNKKYSEENSDKISFAPIGTGPFIIEPWDSGTDKFFLRANKNYFKGSPKIDRLIFWVIKESSNREIAAETGEVDIANALSSADIMKLRENKKVDIIINETMTTDYLALNSSKGNLKYSEYRQAINFAIDKNSLVEVFYKGQGIPASSIVNYKIWGSSDSLKENYSAQYNPEKSKEILRKLNLPNQKLNLWTSNSATRMQMAEVIQANLKEVGIEVVIQSVEWGTFLQKTSEGAHDILIASWYIAAPDPDTILRNLIYSKSIGSGGNRSFYSNSELDRLLEQATENIDENIRLENYKAIQDILARDVPVIPLIHRNDFAVKNKRVNNLTNNKATLRSKFELVELSD